jgi:hypothetical protein
MNERLRIYFNDEMNPGLKTDAGAGICRRERPTQWCNSRLNTRSEPLRATESQPLPGLHPRLLQRRWVPNHWHPIETPAFLHSPSQAAQVTFICVLRIKVTCPPWS